MRRSLLIAFCIKNKPKWAVWVWLTGPHLGFKCNFHFFHVPYFGRQGQSGNEATRQVTKLPLHLGSTGRSGLPGGVQAELNTVHRSILFLSIPFFKVSEWMF